MSSHRFLLITAFALCANILTASSGSMYEQLIPQLTKNINVENPSEEELFFINTCRAHSEGGTQYPQIGTENWQAINSIEMFNVILPKYARTITTSGYIALARQAAQMTDNATILAKRIALTQHLVNNATVSEKLNRIIGSAKKSQEKFFNLFRQLTEEEQEELDKANKKLYFSWYGLDGYNESSTALEIGPRINQLNTAALITVPALLYSFYHLIYSTILDVKASTEKLATCKSDKEIDNSIQAIEAKLEQDITVLRWTIEKYNQIKKELQAKNAADLSANEKRIVNSKSFKELPLEIMESLYLGYAESIAGITYDATKNLPYATADFGKFILKNALWQNPMREMLKAGMPEMSEENLNASSRTLNWTAGIGISLYAFNLYLRYNSTKSLLDLIHEKQHEVLSAGHLIKSMQMMHNIIGSDIKLQNLMSAEYAKLGELFDTNSKKTSADLKNLVNTLMSSSFQGKDSYFFSKQGKILATHHLLNRIKGELVSYLEAFGQVDAYLSTAKLYQEFKNHPRVHFCLPEFVDAQTPVLDAQEYWHPMIDTNKVITNTLGMNYQEAANLIITGPNAGGKTTSLMSLIINIIFAQSFGIAPSSSLRLTPFAKIHSYLDITTNLQEGLSLFAAEVDRAKKLKISIMSCKPGQKTFTIIDEIFSGTAPEVASDVGFTFASQLGEMAHSMTIITTHFPALTGLEEKTGHYVNYKVADATVHPDGSITYPFKLVKGKSTQNIAAQMLQNQGII